MPNPLSLAGRLDNSASRLICTLLSGLKKTLLWLCGLLILALLPMLIFEYGEGLADISLLEWGFMLLLGLLLWRHAHYCRHFSTGFWKGASRLLTSIGILSVVELAMIGLCEIFLWRTEYEELPKHYLLEDDPLVKLATYATLLMALYLAAPSASRNTAVKDDRQAEDTSSPSDNIEPVESDTYKEPTL